MSNPGVLQINSSFAVMRYIKPEHAFSLLARNKAWAFEVIPGKFVRSPSITFAWPTSIVMNVYAHVPHKAPAPTSDVMATRMGVLKRDDWTCAYCGEFANTWDHVWPQSLGGEDTWLNTVAACTKCNQLKANLVPIEAEKRHGLKLLWPPYAPKAAQYNLAKEQDRINKLLAENYGASV